MTYQIDQSGRIEQTNLNTILAITNKNKQIVIIFNRKNKRILQSIFRNQRKIRMFTILTFSALIAILIKKSAIGRNNILIDHEYLADEDFIKEHILQYLQKLKVYKIPKIEFGHVGKTSFAHELAAKVAHQKKKADKIVNLKEVFELALLPIKKIGYPGISGIEGNLTQDWLPGGQNPSRSSK